MAMAKTKSNSSIRNEFAITTSNRGVNNALKKIGYAKWDLGNRSVLSGDILFKYLHHQLRDVCILTDLS